MLEIRDLVVEYPSYGGFVRVLDGVDLDIRQGEIWGIVGESGAGKSVLFRTILGLLPRGWVARGSIRFEGRDVLALSERALEAVRGHLIGLISSNARQSLNPLMPIGRQIAAVIARHQRTSSVKAADRAVALLKAVGIPDPEVRYHGYPHELSGGMCQRAIIAMGIANAPPLILADEPTSGLDVTISVQILDLMREAVRNVGSALVIVSRDLGVIANYAEHVGVILSGRLVEEASVFAFFDDAGHPYSRRLIAAAAAAHGAAGGSRTADARAEEVARQGCDYRHRCPFVITACAEHTIPMHPKAPGHLVRCIRAGELPPLAATAAASVSAPAAGETTPRSGQGKPAAAERPLLTVEHLVKTFATRHGAVHAVTDVSFHLGRGEALALVGESGSGKTTVGRCIMGLIRPDSGSVRFHGQELASLSPREFRRLRERIQFVFQDPTDALNPRFTVGAIIGEPLRLSAGMDRAARSARTQELLSLVGLPPDRAERYPHQLSGGEQQRVGIARAIATKPGLVVLDEPTSALDVSVRAGILDLLQKLRDELGVAYLLISHDLTAVHRLCDRIAIMYLGRIVEVGQTEDLFREPLHPYARALLSSVLYPDPRQERSGSQLKGEIPSAIRLPAGCALHTRCPVAMEICRSTQPLLEAKAPGRLASCLRLERVG